MTIWMIFSWFVYILGHIDSNRLRLTYFFYILLIGTSCFKRLLKYFARKIDIVRMNTIDNSNSKLCLISLEITSEFAVNITYYATYYFYFMFDLLNDKINHSILLFIQIAAIHILSEICQSIIRFSQLYFQVTSKWTDRFTTMCKTSENSKCSYFIKFLDKFLTNLLKMNVHLMNGK